LLKIVERALQLWERVFVYAVYSASSVALLFAVINVAKALGGQTV
jgi:hypothetical protein